MKNPQTVKHEQWMQHDWLLSELKSLTFSLRHVFTDIYGITYFYVDDAAVYHNTADFSKWQLIILI